MSFKLIARGMVAGTLALALSTPAGAALFPGDVAPNFNKIDLDGNPQTLAQYQGKVVFLFLLGYN